MARNPYLCLLAFLLIFTSCKTFPSTALINEETQALKKNRIQDSLRFAAVFGQLDQFKGKQVGELLAALDNAHLGHGEMVDIPGLVYGWAFLFENENLIYVYLVNEPSSFFDVNFEGKWDFDELKKQRIERIKHYKTEMDAAIIYLKQVPVDFYPNEQIKRMNFFNDNNLLIEIKEWYPNGMLKSHLYNIQYYNDEYTSLYDEVMTVDNLHFADVTHYFPNGKKKVSSAYRMGKNDGVWFYWDEASVLYKKEIYKNGERVDVIEY